MNSQNIKKRIFVKENRIYQVEGVNNFSLISNNEKSRCLTCKATTENNKVSNSRSRYEITHPLCPMFIQYRIANQSTCIVV